MKAYLFIIIICATSISSKAYCQANTNVSQPKANKMKQFSLLVRVPESYNTAEAESAAPQWNKTIEKWKAEGAYIFSFAFPGESYTINGLEKKVKKEIIFSNNLKVVSQVILQSETMERALELAKYCPVLSYGGSVEVREIPKPIAIGK